MRVRVFLRQPLFTLPHDAHVPPTAVVLVGTLGEDRGGLFDLTVESWYDERGRQLEGLPRNLLIPTAKVDHVLVEGA